jgi:hypothetical protein
VERHLPEDAVVLVHDYHAVLGFGRKTVSDAVAWQGGIDYLQNPSDLGVYNTLSKLGVTHIVRQGYHFPWESQGSNLVFLGFVVRHGLDPKDNTAYRWVRMPDEAPSEAAAGPRVLVAVCPPSYATGMYPITALDLPGLDTVGAPLPPPELPIVTSDVSALREALSRVSAVLLNPQCHPAVEPLLRSHFKLGATRGADQQWVRFPEELPR